MEFRILNPSEEGFLKKIEWNHEELEKELLAKLEEYRGLQYTEENIRVAKADRATLNKLLTAIDNKRKEIKKLINIPYMEFETQVKKIIALIEEPIQLIDSQIKEVEEKRRKEKQEEIENLFQTIGFQSFVELDMIFDKKWLGSSVPISKIEEQMKLRMHSIGNDIYTIEKLSDFQFEAMEVYRTSLDLNRAVQEGHRLAEIQKRKAEHEAEQKRLKEAEQNRRTEEAAAKQETIAVQQSSEEQRKVEECRDKTEGKESPVYAVGLHIYGTKIQLDLFCKFLLENQINYDVTEKPRLYREG